MINLEVATALRRFVAVATSTLLERLRPLAELIELPLRGYPAFPSW